MTPKEHQHTLNQLNSDYSDICLYTNQDIELAFHAADIMISDVSSIAFEFMALEKPVFFYNSPLMKTHPKYNPNDIEYQYRLNQLCFTSPNQLIPLINTIFEDPNINLFLRDTGNLFIDKRKDASALIVQKAIKCRNNTKNDILILKDRTLERIMLYNSSKFYDELNINMNGYEMIVPVEVIKTLLRSNIKYFVCLFNLKELSPNLISYLQNAVFRFPELLICPLSDNQDYPKQNIVNYYPETKEMSFQSIKTPLSYRYSGKVTMIDDFLPKCFAFSNTLLNDLFKKMECLNDSVQSIDLIDCLRKFKYDIVCIHDAIYQ